MKNCLEYSAKQPGLYCFSTIISRAISPLRTELEAGAFLVFNQELSWQYVLDQKDIVVKGDLRQAFCTIEKQIDIHWMDNRFIIVWRHTQYHLYTCILMVLFCRVAGLQITIIICTQQSHTHVIITWCQINIHYCVNCMLVLYRQSIWKVAFSRFNLYGLRIWLLLLHLPMPFWIYFYWVGPILIDENLDGIF